MYSVEELRQNYKKLSDNKIERIAKNDSRGLRKEAQEILKDEIKKRNHDRNLLTWIEAETNILTDAEKQFLIDRVTNLPCPKCLQISSKLNGYKINQVISLFIYTDVKSEIKIVCSNCGSQEKLHSILITLVAGWWLKKGILLTPYVLIIDLINLFFQKKISNQILNELLETNNGLLRLNGMRDETLTDLILIYNQKNKSEE